MPVSRVHKNVNFMSLYSKQYIIYFFKTNNCYCLAVAVFKQMVEM